MQISDIPMNSASLSQEEKSSAAFLRERFLFLIASLPADKPCKIDMYDKTTVTAQIRAFDLSFENVLVENLKPPHPRASLSSAILRTSDINSISYQDV